MRARTSLKKLQTLQKIHWTAIKQGRRGSEISSLFHVSFCLLFPTPCGRYTLFLCATSLPHPSTCFRCNTNPPVWVPWEVHKNILQYSRLVPPASAISPRITFLNISLYFFIWVLPILLCTYCASLTVPTHGDVSSVVWVTRKLQIPEPLVPGTMLPWKVGEGSKPHWWLKRGEIWKTS